MKSDRKSVIVDVDGVACAHADAICKQINKEYGLGSSPRDVLSWDHDFGPITFVQAVEKYYPRPGFVMSMECTLGFKDFLQQISANSIVTFATTRTHARSETVSWVRENFGDAFEVEFVSSKCILGANAVIDDSPKEILEVATRGGLAILYRQPWNDNDEVERGLQNHPLARRVRSFQDAVSVLKKFCFLG